MYYIFLIFLFFNIINFNIFPLTLFYNNKYMNIELIFLTKLFLNWYLSEENSYDLTLFLDENNNIENLIDDLFSILWKRININDNKILKDDFTKEDIEKLDLFLIHYINWKKEYLNKAFSIKILYEKYILNSKWYEYISKISESYFQNREEMLDSIIMCYILDYIDIVNIWYSEYKDVKDRGSIHYIIDFKDDFKLILEKYWDINQIFLDKLINDEYKKIILDKSKSWKISLNLSIDEKNISTKIVDIVKDFPYSDINLKVHDGKITKYEVIKKEIY